MKQEFSQKNARAAAIISVLLIIAMLSLLVISYLVSMRTEHRASVSFANTQRAKMVAQGAVAHAIELMRTNIPDPAGIDKSATTSIAQNWVINPGRLTIFDESGTEKIVPLHTGGATDSPDSTTDPDVYSVDLNEPVPGKLVTALCSSVTSF